ncbi:uncharacterized protein [Rutidosis leptorrhynchoides]|uniref:uncharacterized protein n=1 Tax=Rutidosis leptorrhynchoides TaxID=125765 RepID=UPI003A98D3C7
MRQPKDQLLAAFQLMTSLKKQTHSQVTVFSRVVRWACLGMCHMVKIDSSMFMIGPKGDTFMQVFASGVDKVTMATRASRFENQDDIDTAIISMLADLKRYYKDATDIVSWLENKDATDIAILSTLADPKEVLYLLIFYIYLFDQ